MDEQIFFKFGKTKVLPQSNWCAKFHPFNFKNDVFAYIFLKNTFFKKILKNQRINGSSPNLARLKCFLRAIIMPSFIALPLKMAEI